MVQKFLRGRRLFSLLTFVLLLLPARTTFAVRPPDLPESLWRLEKETSRQQFEGESYQEREKVSAPLVTAEQISALQAWPGLEVSWFGNNGTPSRLRGFQVPVSGDPSSAALSFLNQIKGIYRMKDPYQEMRVYLVQEDDLGYRHIRLRQFYQGLPVIGSELVVHINRDQKIYQVNGRYSPQIDNSVAPQITPEVAVQSGAKYLAGLSFSVASPPQLVIYPSGNRYYLAYRYLLSGTDNKGNAFALVHYVDAQTGIILNRYNDVKYIAPPSGGGSHKDISGTRLSGEDGNTVTVEGWHETTNADTYYLYNKNRWWYIWNCGHNPSYTYDQYTYAYRLGGGGDWDAVSPDPIEISAAKNFYDTQEYFYRIFGRRSYNGLSSYAAGNVHYGLSYANAFWDRSQFYFGDGDGSQADPLTTLDIVAHEYGHAVTDYSCQLFYQDESGALNESFSDIIAASIEIATQGVKEGRDARGIYPATLPGYADWLIGEDAWLESLALRDMRNPTNQVTVGEGNQQPARYHGPFWADEQDLIWWSDSGGVHQNSGVQNFFYYLLTEGGSATAEDSPSGLPYTITGLGIYAPLVAYRAQTYYAIWSDTYQTIRDAWIDAAYDYGGSSWAQVAAAAWDAVGIIEVPANLYESFEGSSLVTGWTTGGDKDWFISTVDKVAGSKSCQSGPITHSQTTFLQWEGTLTDTGIFSFFLRVSSERGCDILSFWVDGERRTGWSGEVPWTSYCEVLGAGHHTLRWEYTKDSSANSGSDAVWLDAISFSSGVITHNILATASGKGTISPQGLVVVSDGAIPTFTITPFHGYHLAELLVDEVSVDTYGGTRTSYTFPPVHEDHTISVSFGINNNTISGRVTRGTTTEGLEGVVLSLVSEDLPDTTHTDTTDASGNYLFADIPAGNYTLTPAKEGWTFEPAQLMLRPFLATAPFTADFAAYAPFQFTTPPSGSPNPVTKGGVVQCTVEASNATSYLWTAEDGYFQDTGTDTSATQNPKWVADVRMDEEPLVGITISVKAFSSDGRELEESFIEWVRAPEVPIETGGAGGCFIATAAYGTPFAKEVESLRLFRDRYLVGYRWGRAFIRFYYRHSPPIAQFLKTHSPIWRLLVRTFLTPVVWLVRIGGFGCLTI